jgi:predicted secreted Zn-dependent protease
MLLLQTLQRNNERYINSKTSASSKLEKVSNAKQLTSNCIQSRWKQKAVSKAVNMYYDDAHVIVFLTDMFPRLKSELVNVFMGKGELQTDHEL